MINRLNIRQLTEQKEESLSPNAVQSRRSRGRHSSEEPDPIRTAFQRDRDRIIYSKSFRRLKHKTQVFIAPQGDHYVTRLTHTLEVSQIARTIARALNLNEDLTEAISLGHDLGHTPFGHVGEEVLNELYHEGFRHSEQSLRIVDILENDGNGLNLTWEVRDGILNHSKTGLTPVEESVRANTYEGEICKISDIIAYINHDIDDAIRAGVIKTGEIPMAAIMELGNSHSLRINTMVTDVIQKSWSLRIIKCPPGTVITMSPNIKEAMGILREFLFARVYNTNPTESEKAREIVRKLYRYFMTHEDKMPPEYALYSEEVERRVVDYIAGMTDQYAMRLAEEYGLINTTK